MSEKLREKVCLMNMCVIMDGNNNVVALDKVSRSYSGTTFPGGHIEKGESFEGAMIREIREETGLTIRNPELLGLYHWNENDIHNVGLIYTASDFEGDLVSSEEGKVYWIPLEELKKKELARGSEYIVQMLEDRTINECFIELTEDGYKGTLYRAE